MHRPSTSTIIACTALFFSIVGTGLAAKGKHPTPPPTHYVITTTKQIKPSVISSLRGSQGPRGVAGPQGPAGAAGAPGAAGAAGTFSTANETVVTGTTPGGFVPANTGTATSLATCPAGDVVVGGGYTWGIAAPPAGVVVQTSFAQGTNAWAVTMQNISGAAASSNFAAEAICAS